MPQSRAAKIKADRIKAVWDEIDRKAKIRADRKEADAARLAELRAKFVARQLSQRTPRAIAAEAYMAMLREKWIRDYHENRQPWQPPLSQWEFREDFLKLNPRRGPWAAMNAHTRYEDRYREEYEKQLLGQLKRISSRSELA